jgi:hypothetical protein
VPSHSLGPAMSEKVAVERDASVKGGDDAVPYLHTDINTKTEDIYGGDTLDPVYKAKAMVLNDALQEIGMGKYQVCLS